MKKPTPPKFGVFRLTLSEKAYLLAVTRSKPLAGFGSVKRPDGKVDVAVKASVANLLRQLADPKENLSDTVVRLLSPTKEGV